MREGEAVADMPRVCVVRCLSVGCTCVVVPTVRGACVERCWCARRGAGGVPGACVVLPVRARTAAERAHGDPVERQVRSSPHDTLANVRYRFRDLDARLQRLEKYVTSSRYKLDREFQKLEE